LAGRHQDMADLWVLLPAMLVMNQIDWTQERNVIIARSLYGLVQVLSLGCCALIYQKIMARRDTTKVRVAQPASWGSPAGPDQEIPAYEYDVQQLKKAAAQTLFGAALVIFVHFKFGIIQPLFIQTVMNPVQMYKSPLFQIFLWGTTGDIEKRPFKEENPFSKLLSAPEGAAAQAAETVEALHAADAAQAEDSDSTNQASGAAKKKKKKRQAPMGVDE